MLEISAQEFSENREKFLLIDVREMEEHKEASIPDSLNIPLGELPQRHTELPQGKPIVVMCARGGRSAQAVKFLAKHNIEAINLVGGITALQKFI